MTPPERTVLLITSLPGQADSYGRMLRYETTVCYRVVEMLGDGQIASQYQPAQIDGVLLDADGSERHGLDLLQQLQQLRGNPCPPIIVIGEDDLKTAVAALKAGAADYLVKEQLTPEGLCLALEAAISGRSAARIAPKLRETQTEAAIAAPPQLPPVALVDALPQMVWMADRTGAVHYWNQCWYEYTGLSPAKSAGLAGASCVHPQEYGPTLVKWTQAIIEGKAFEIEHRIRRHDGVYRWFINRGLPTRDRDGQITGWIGTVVDIDGHKRLEERFQLVVQAVNGLVFDASEVSLDRDDCVYRSEQLFNLIGVHANEAPPTSRWWEDRIHPDDRARLRRRMQELFASSSQLYESDYRVRHQDGRWVDVWERGCLVRDEQGRVIRVVGSTVDISQQQAALRDRNQAERQLHQTTERLNIALKSAPISLFNQDLDLRYTWIYNPTHDLSVDQVIGRRDEDLATPKTAARLTHLKRQVIATGIGLREEVKVVTNGQTAYYDLTIDPIHDDQHAIVGVTCAAVDISERIYIATEHQQAELALQESEDCLRMAIESARMGIWDLNITTNQLTWDAGCKAIFGLPPEADSSLERFYEGLHPDDRDRLRQTIAEALTPVGGGICDVEYRVIGLQDRVERWVRAKGQVYFDRHGTPLRFIGTVLDITQQKQAEAAREQLLRQEQAAREAAERANRIKDEFLAILSHELRSPLNPILGWAKLLQTKKLDAAKTARALETIERNAKLQTQLIDDLLDIAKILRGKLKIEPASVDPVFVIESAIETVQAAADAKGIRIQSDLPDIGLIQGDGARIQQIVWNLLTNAIKFTPEQGQITIQLAQVDHWAQLRVTDTGRGICPKFLPHIFDSFRQADTSITRQFGGLGLGLAIVRYLAEAHGGTIAADSPGEGHGATFTVSLPLLSDRPSQRVAAVLPGEIDLTGVRVIAVDDNPDGLALLTLLLGEYGAEVVGFESAAKVLTTLESFNPHVLVSDIGMPEMDGYALIQQIRTLPPEQGGQVPAIALSAYVREEDAQKALNSGFQLHLAKPIEPDTIARAVAQLVQS